MALNIKDNSKRFWRYVSTKDKSRQTIPFLLNPEGKKLEDPEDIANLMNNTFASNFSVETLTSHHAQSQGWLSIQCQKFTSQLTRLRKG